MHTYMSKPFYMYVYIGLLPLQLSVKVGSSLFLPDILLDSNTLAHLFLSSSLPLSLFV